MIFESVVQKEYKKKDNIHQKVATVDKKIINILLNNSKNTERKVDAKIDNALNDLFGTISMPAVTTYKDSQEIYTK